MTNEQEIKWSAFEEKIRGLLKTCTDMRSELADVKAQLLAKQEELEASHHKIQELQAQYDNLKIARVVTINQQEVTNAKKKLSGLVREVDRCIALLNN